MPESHDQLFTLEHAEHTFSRLFGRRELLNQLHRSFVGAAVQRSAKRADRAADG